MDKIRRYDLDWLRVSGVLLVIIFHSLMIFILEPWAVVYIKDAEYIHFFKPISNLIHVFNMPLLFIVAGMAVSFSLRSRSSKQFMIERIKKLLLPAVLGCILMNPIMTYIYVVSKNRNINFFKYLVEYFTKNPGDLSGVNGGFTPAHLWFLIFLFIFSFVCLPLFIKLRKTEATAVLDKISTLLGKPYALMVTIIPIALGSAVDILDDKNPIVYLLMFFLGFMLMTSPRYQIALNRDKWGYLIMSVVFICISMLNGMGYSAWSLSWILYGLVERSASMITVFAALGLANCYINKKTGLLNYLSKASFTVYIIHMLINTLVGFFVVKLSIDPVIKFLLIVIGTCAFSIMGYELIRRIACRYKRYVL